MNIQISMRYILLLMILWLYNSCSKDIDCTTLESCFEHDGLVTMITVNNNLSNRDGDTSIISTNIDTMTFRLKIECGEFVIGEDEYALKGDYEIVNDEILFVQDKEPCPIDAECIHSFHYNKYKWSCQENETVLTSFVEYISIHDEGSIFGSYNSSQYTRTVTY